MAGNGPVISTYSNEYREAQKEILAEQLAALGVTLTEEQLDGLAAKASEGAAARAREHVEKAQSQEKADVETLQGQGTLFLRGQELEAGKEAIADAFLRLLGKGFRISTAQEEDGALVNVIMGRSGSKSSEAGGPVDSSRMRWMGGVVYVRNKDGSIPDLLGHIEANAKPEHKAELKAVLARFVDVETGAGIGRALSKVCALDPNQGPGDNSKRSILDAGFVILALKPTATTYWHIPEGATGWWRFGPKDGESSAIKSKEDWQTWNLPEIKTAYAEAEKDRLQEKMEG